jgi:hypothetical protein
MSVFYFRNEVKMKATLSYETSVIHLRVLTASQAEHKHRSLHRRENLECHINPESRRRATALGRMYYCTPLYHRGDKTDCSNCRKVSLSPPAYKSKSALFCQKQALDRKRVSEEMSAATSSHLRPHIFPSPTCSNHRQSLFLN